MSIKKKITLLFMSSLTVMLGIGVWIEYMNEQKNQQLLIAKYLSAAKELIPVIANSNRKALTKKLRELQLIPSKTPLSHPIYEKPFTFGKITVFKNSHDYFLVINYLDETLTLYDKTQKIFATQRYITYVMLIVDVAILVAIYFAILKIFSPIKELSKKMENYAKGAYETRMQIQGDKEIQIVAKSFNDLAQSLQNSIQERENLLKFIGHELKTPLAKAKFALERKDIVTLTKNIKDIERLVNEILHMHVFSMQNLKIQRFKAQTLIAEALNRLYIENEENIEIEIEDFTIEADLYYMSIAMKNLIDNALRYTQKFPIHIIAKKGGIEVVSFGERLNKPLHFYLQPFYKENSSGHGLGLSIAKTIIHKHRFKLYYRFEGKNIFGIAFTRTTHEQNGHICKE